MRVKTGTVRRRYHKKILKRAQGFIMARRRQYQAAKEAVIHSGAYAYHGRKLKKRNFRRLWIQRINAALNASGIKYSRFVKALKDNHILLDRKILAELAVNDDAAFRFIIDQVHGRKTP